MTTSALRRFRCDGATHSQGAAPHRVVAGHVEEIVRRGRRAYLDDVLLQEAGDSLMMKLGEAANRLAQLGVLAPEGVDWALAVANRNFLIHQYDEIDRALTWVTLSRDLPQWRRSLRTLVQEAEAAVARPGEA